MIKVGQISKGMCLILKGQPYLIVEREFVTPGKGQAFARIKFKNLINGSTLTETMKTGDDVQEADVGERNASYMFTDSESYHFMDTANFEQFEIPIAGMEDRAYYLLENETYKIVLWDNKPIEIVVPTKMVFTMVDAPDAIRGDTVSGATKLCKTETGLTVKCPIFIKQNERIRINTETNEYLERVND